MEGVGGVFQGKRGMKMYPDETKIDKAISWVVIALFLFSLYNLLGMGAELIREMLKHIF